MQLGFDYCYDKRLYDRLVHDEPEAIRRHLHADQDYQRHMVRFIENHDEPRAASEFTPAKERAAAVAIATLPGATLWHEGQFEGWHVRLPVFLDRRPAETTDDELRGFSVQLLGATATLRSGEWALCEATGWPEDTSYAQLLAWSWIDSERRSLIVINYADCTRGCAGPSAVERPRWTEVATRGRREWRGVRTRR